MPGLVTGRARSDGRSVLESLPLPFRFERIVAFAGGKVTFQSSGVDWERGS